MKALISNKILIDGELKKAVIFIQNGKIDSIVSELPEGFQGEVFDYKDLVIMPGIVDTHVHINEPGRTEWEGFNTATRAAAAGGITTVIDMPLNCIPATTTKKSFEEKLESVKDKLWVDVGFWGGAVPDELDNLEELLDAGVMGVKTFLIDSGVPEFKHMTESDLKVAMPIIAKKNVPYLIHAEIDDGHTNDITDDYATFVASRPNAWEDNAIELMINLTKEFKTKTHIVHLAAASSIEQIKNAKDSGLNFTVETCPHYLTIASEDIPKGKTVFKCCPPIRERENLNSLWNGIKDGSIDFIVSDHSPCTPQLKLIDQGDLDKAWGGISSLQFSLPLVWTEASKRGFTLQDISRLMSQNTAKFVGLESKKGSIIPGMDADFVVWDPEEEYTISSDLIEHRHKVTPYEGRKVKGKVYSTFVRGEKVFDQFEFQGPIGNTILRGKNE